MARGRNSRLRTPEQEFQRAPSISSQAQKNCYQKKCRESWVCAAPSCCSNNWNASHQLIVRFAPSLPLSDDVHAWRSAVTVVPGSGATSPVSVCSRTLFPSHLQSPSEGRKNPLSGACYPSAPSSADLCIYQSVNPFISAKLNASRSSLLPTAAAADAEERRALRLNRRVKKRLCSSPPPSAFHKAAPPPPSLSHRHQITISQMPRPCNKHRCRQGCRQLHAHTVNAERNWSGQANDRLRGESK